MTRSNGPAGSRRRFMAIAGGTAGALGTEVAVAAPAANLQTGDPRDMTATEPFFGMHQNGIGTPNPQQGNVCFAALDITTDDRKDLVATLKAWTRAATRLTEGRLVNTRTAKEHRTVSAHSASVRRG